jgi:hypothetical protein
VVLGNQGTSILKLARLLNSKMGFGTQQRAGDIIVRGVLPQEGLQIFLGNLAAIICLEELLQTVAQQTGDIRLPVTSLGAAALDKAPIHMGEAAAHSARGSTPFSNFSLELRFHLSSESGDSTAASMGTAASGQTAK